MENKHDQNPPGLRRRTAAVALLGALALSLPGLTQARGNRGGCGSRGGPGNRKSNGKCASWSK